MFFKKKYFIVCRNRTIHYIFLSLRSSLHLIYMPHCRWCRFSAMGVKVRYIFPCFLLFVVASFCKKCIYTRSMVAFTLGSSLPLRYVHSLLSAIADLYSNINMTIKLT